MEDNFGRVPGFSEFLQGWKKDVNEVILLKKSKKVDPSKTHFTVRNLLFLEKAIRKLKWDVPTK